MLVTRSKDKSPGARLSDESASVTYALIAVSTIRTPSFVLLFPAASSKTREYICSLSGKLPISSVHSPPALSVVEYSLLFITSVTVPASATVPVKMIESTEALI